jgi:hypothetical protein
MTTQSVAVTPLDATTKTGKRINTGFRSKI